MSKVIEANQKVHALLIKSGEYQKSPHRSLESQRKLRDKIAALNFVGDDQLKHLDVGCGDGFMFDCTPKAWARFGVDITDEMLLECGKRHPDVDLRKGLAEQLPFEDESFDFVTCYSFLDHLEKTEIFYKEALRVLRPGGWFYFGLSPNRDFSSQLKAVPEFDVSSKLKEMDLEIELKKAFDDGSYYQEAFGVSAADLLDCEPGKSLKKGLLPSEEVYKLKSCGVFKPKVIYEWIFQQNHIDPQAVKILHEFLPFTAACFKYFDLVGQKNDQ